MTTADFNLPPVFWLREKSPRKNLAEGEHLVVSVQPDMLLIPFVPLTPRQGPSLLGIKVDDLHHCEFSTDRKLWQQFIALSQ